MVDLPAVLSRPGATLRYADAGGGGAGVVLIHGAGVDHAMWEPQRQALSRAGHRTVVWDLRGHGRSRLQPGVRFRAADALDDLAVLLEATGLTSPVLVGHSLGGNLGQAFVRRHPERVRGLVVVDATWNTGPLRPAERVGLRLAAPLLALVPASRLPELMARASAVTPEGIGYARSVFAAMPKAGFLDVWRATASLVEPEEGYRTPVPLALVRGARDRTGNIASAMPRWARAEGVDEQVVAAAGHLVTLDAPDATSRTLLRLLEQWGAEDRPTAQK
ncbi:alpha/beta fold hydrolase [Auraticoccus sp. F435]|uniref:Alpha/beta fold hydrolase n=1 Tax=Auraticoccus cholistanensis TaxID=2656650 RepID=A0A6A9UXC8_9ACTN|nr:alpha/beta hydrolase [Auraticoccus cholistanensis]MVA76292.1 alpha/beta fold hydrolase [Auraticoccus cholistanensis]